MYFKVTLSKVQANFNILYKLLNFISLHGCIDASHNDAPSSFNDSTFRNYDLRIGGSRSSSLSFDCLDKFHPIYDLACFRNQISGGYSGNERNHTKDNMRIVQPASYNGGDEELRPVSIFSSVSHGEETRLAVLEVK